MTTEMLERATIELEETLHDLGGTTFDLLMHEAIKHKLQHLSVAAVREAVLELAPYLECHVNCESWDDALCTCGLSVLRQKFGVGE